MGNVVTRRANEPERLMGSVNWGATISFLPAERSFAQITYP